MHRVCKSFGVFDPLSEFSQTGQVVKWYESLFLLYWQQAWCPALGLFRKHRWEDLTRVCPHVTRDRKDSCSILFVMSIPCWIISSVLSVTPRKVINWINCNLNLGPQRLNRTSCPTFAHLLHNRYAFPGTLLDGGEIIRSGICVQLQRSFCDDPSNPVWESYTYDANVKWNP